MVCLLVYAFTEGNSPSWFLCIELYITKRQCAKMLRLFRITRIYYRYFLNK